MADPLASLPLGIAGTKDRMDLAGKQKKAPKKNGGWPSRYQSRYGIIKKHNANAIFLPLEREELSD